MRVDACMFIGIYACMLCMYTYIHKSGTKPKWYVCTYVCMSHIGSNEYDSEGRCMYVHRYVFMYVYMYVCIYESHRLKEYDSEGRCMYVHRYVCMYAMYVYLYS